jgi:hypothetical protein
MARKVRTMAGIRAILIAVVFIFGLSGGAANGQSPKKIRIGYPSLSFRQSNVWVAKEMKLFDKYGLEVEPIFLRGGQMATQALVAGDPPIVNIGTVVQASLQGYNLVLVAAVETTYDQIVFARKGINKLEELKGKKFGISGYGSATHNAANILFQHLKLDVNKDVALVPTGPDAERFGAMTAGRIDATFFTSSAAAPARKAGFNELFHVADLGVEVQGNGFATALLHCGQPRHGEKRAQRFRRSDLFCLRQQERSAESFRQIHAHQRSRNTRRLLQRLYQVDSQEALSHAQGHPVHVGPGGAAVTACEERQAGAVRGFELPAGTGERGVL